MQKLPRFAFVSALMTVASMAVAHAADLLPLKAPRLAAPPVSTWTGFYAGVNLGYGMGSDPSSSLAVSGAAFPGGAGAGVPLYGGPSSFNVSPRGVTGGGQIGYNYQIDPSWVMGVEADIQGSGMRGSSGCIITCNAPIASINAAPYTAFPVTFTSNSDEQKLDWFGTVRGRLGYAVGPVLLYGTGGFAYGEVNQSGNVTGSSATTAGAVRNTFSGSYNTTSMRTGWTAGAGVEGKLSSNWSIKAEWLYIDLGTVTDNFNSYYTSVTGPAFGTVGGVAAVRTDTFSVHDSIFRVGLNYKIGN